MKKRKIIVALCSFFLFQAACVRQVKVPTRNSNHLLVVQGLITTAPGPYTINLSYSGPYTNSYQASRQDSLYFITDAKVVIRDNLGDSTNCTYTDFGNYVSTDTPFAGVVGRTYTLVVYLSNGSQYLSKPETLQAVSPIDSLSIGYDSAGLTNMVPAPLIVTVNTHDPGSGPHYYRWSSSGYFPRKSYGSPCNINDPPCSSPFVCTCHALCEEENTSAGALKIFSNQLSQGKEVIEPAYYSPVFWYGDHYVEIDQYSLTLESYQFWQRYQEQTDRTGSILDPLPSPVIGNIYNARDSNDLALGIFSASDVFKKKVVLVPFFLQEYELESFAGQYILQGDCQAVYPNALPDNTPPSGWDSAQIINLH
ncbi:MAG TPA: DUF4249 domain-containing protein [Puia sp.]|nr:DUF4249 domain-containing protein [Puia sp.]